MSDFQKIDDSSHERMYGPRAAVVCGMSKEEQSRVLQLLGSIEDLRVVFATDAERDEKIAELMEREHESGAGRISPMTRLMLLSGLTQAEFHEVMSGYRASGLPRPIWASLTPYSAAWTLGQLLDELEEERKEFERRKATRQ